MKINNKEYNIADNNINLNHLLSIDNIQIIDGNKMNYMKIYPKGTCEKNVFDFIKSLEDYEMDIFYPVSGLFLYNGIFVDHYWIYNKKRNQHIEISMNEKPDLYIGLINYNINNDIKLGNKINEIPFLMNNIYKLKTKTNIKENLINIIKEELNKINNNVYTLYHGTNKDLKLTNNKIWVTPDIEYAKIWGDNIYEIKFKLNKIFDTVTDLNNKKITLKQLIKYLKNKNVNTDELEWASKDYIDNPTKYLFWNFIGDASRPINYSWIYLDIFMSNYDAIKLFEYGFRKKDKGITYLIYKPLNKILSVNKIN